MRDKRERRNMRRSRRARAGLRARGIDDGAQTPRPVGSPSCATEQAARAPKQDSHRQRINEKRTKLRKQIFEASVRNTEQKRCNERTPDAAKSADGYDDQEIGEVLQSVAGTDGQQM